MPLCKLLEPLLAESETNFLDLVLPDIQGLVQLGDLLLLASVDIKVLAIDNDLLVEVVDFLLLHLLHLFHHVVARDEHGLEVIGVGEELIFIFVFAWIRLFSLGVSLKALEKPLGFFHLLEVRVLEALDCGRVGSLRVLVPVLSLHDVVESTLGLPAALVLLFRILLDLIFVDEREAQAKVVCRICIKVVLVLRYLLSELLFLELPDVQFLRSVLEHVDTIRNVQSLNKGPSGAHRSNFVLVSLLVVLGGQLVPLEKQLLELLVEAVGVSLSLFRLRFLLNLLILSLLLFSSGLSLASLLGSRTSLGLVLGSD